MKKTILVAAIALLSAPFEYNADGNLVLAKEADWDGAQWGYTGKEETVYIEGTDYVKKLLYYMYNTGTSSFINTGFNTYYYHDKATAIDRVAAQSAKTTKVIRNGQLLIIHDGVTYNLQGAKVD